MNQSNTQGFRGYRASPTTGQGRDYKGRAFSVMYKEKAKFAVGVFKPNGISYAIGLKPGRGV